ncbi:MAG: ferredoxin [Bacteroidia bacterium]|jgi:ferredoxin
MDKIIQLIVTDLEGKVHTIEAPTDMGLNVMEAIKANELPIKATCGGMAMCATCNVVVTSNHELAPMTEGEEDMLDQAFVLDVKGSRLSCQLPCSEKIDGLELTLGKLTDPFE